MRGGGSVDGAVGDGFRLSLAGWAVDVAGDVVDGIGHGEQVCAVVVLPLRDARAWLSGTGKLTAVVVEEAGGVASTVGL